MVLTLNKETMKKEIYFAFIALAIGTIVSCQSPDTGSATDSSNKVVLKGVEKPFSQEVKSTVISFTLNSSKSDTLHLENGTTIYIPENIFVDSKNQLVTGEIKLDYTEFHNAPEILISGIPMKWDSAGKAIDFQTAGMMEIRAFQNGEILNIVKGKSITVDMASYAEGEDYGSFYFNETENNWSCLTASTSKENTYKKDQLNNIENEKEVVLIKPLAYDPEAYTFDLDINYSKFPELKELNGIMWQYAGKSSKDDPRNVPDFKLKKWNNIQIDRMPSADSEFSLKLLDVNNKTFATVVKPVLRGKMLEAAEKLFAAKFEAYQKKLEFKKAEKERLAKQADMFRTFEVQNMGIYNYDRQLKLEDRIDLLVDFDFGGQGDSDINKIEIFLITGNGKAVVHYPKYNWNLFAFSPSSDNKLIAVLPHDKIAVFSQKDFNALDLKQFKKGGRSNFTFKMKILDTAIKSPEQLNNMLVSL